MSHPLSQHFPRFGRLARHVLFMDMQSDYEPDTDDNEAEDDRDDGNGSGSGVLLTEHYAVTANHVVAPTTRLTAYATHFQSHRPYLRSGKHGAVVKVVWQDQLHDLAIVKLHHVIDALPGYDDYRFGAGYVHGYEIIDHVTRFRASLAAGPGTSGGPLFDFHSGELVGIVTHVHDSEDMAPAAHGMPLRTLFALLAAQDPDLHRKILAHASR